MEFTAETGASVILSSHLVADLERVCDYLIVLAASHVLVAGDVDDLLATHPRLIGARDAAAPAGATVVQQSHTERQSTLIVRSSAPIDDPAWTADSLDLEDLVLAYMAAALPDRHAVAAI
jgi:ABC-2 type transport system ATP-binding protein